MAWQLSPLSYIPDSDGDRLGHPLPLLVSQGTFVYSGCQLAVVTLPGVAFHKTEFSGTVLCVPCTVLQISEGRHVPHDDFASGHEYRERDRAAAIRVVPASKSGGVAKASGY